MTHLVEELRREAEADIAAMRDAARRARDAHAWAELMRHMLMTAGKVVEQPPARRRALHRRSLARGVASRARILAARAGNGSLRGGIPRVCAAAPTRAHDADGARDLRKAGSHAFSAAGMPIADQMAWRSVCAHGWWAQVRPGPARTRPSGPRLARPSRCWEHGCLPECL